VKIVNVRYGYFTTLQFLMSNQRQHSVRSFADAYIQEITLNPSIHPKNIFVFAHSNGTFAFAEACRQHDQIQVGRALLAASVLPRGFFRIERWFDRRTEDDRCPILESLNNQCFARDWAVAVLCRGVRFLASKIGTAGYYGFDETAQRGRIKNTFHDGGHQTAVAPENHGHIATFLASGALESGVESRPKPSRFSVLSHCGNLLMPVAYLLVLAVILFFANIGSRERLSSVFLPFGRDPIWCVAALSFVALVVLHNLRIALTSTSSELVGFICIKFKYITFLTIFGILFFVALGWLEPSGAVLNGRSSAALVGGALALCFAWLLMKV
jgi:hypothetical protein